MQKMLTICTLIGASLITTAASALDFRANSDNRTATASASHAELFVNCVYDPSPFQGISLSIKNYAANEVPTKQKYRYYYSDPGASTVEQKNRSLTNAAMWRDVGGNGPPFESGVHIVIYRSDRHTCTTRSSLSGTPTTPPTPSCAVSANSIDLGVLNLSELKGVSKSSTVTVRCTSTTTGILTAVGQSNQQEADFPGNPGLKGILRVDGETGIYVTAGPSGRSAQWSVTLETQGGATVNSGNYKGIVILRFIVL